MKREEFRKLTSVYENCLKQEVPADEQKTITEYFDSVKSLDEVFHFTQRFEIKRSNISTVELTFTDLTHRIGEPVYDSISCNWVIIDAYRNDEIHFSDGTVLCNDPYILKGRFFDKWQDLTDEQLFTRALLRRTESYESLAEFIYHSEKTFIEKQKILKKIIYELNSVKEDLCQKPSDIQIISNSIVCIETISKVLEEMEDTAC